MAYAANTNQGIVRDYNEDRVSIILNILKPASRKDEEWPKCSFFGVYDGHGGAGCADFLRDNLHQFVIREQSFPWNPKDAIRAGFTKAEQKFKDNNVTKKGIIDKSGSCAVVSLIVGDMCYVANVGDSRAVLSGEKGKKVYPLSVDHKPTDEREMKRIKENGGHIYQTQTQLPRSNPDEVPQIIIGPHRVMPGRLSVSRTFGDLEAKIEKFGGNANVVVAIPDIKTFRVTKDHDFLGLASDGIYDKINNKEFIRCVWNSVVDGKCETAHQQIGRGVEYILKNSLLRKTLDNVTVVLVAFQSFKTEIVQEDQTERDQI